MNYEQRWGHPRRKKKDGSRRRRTRRAAAEYRQAIYDALTTQEKIELALSRSGMNYKELRRLGYFTE